MKFAFYKDNTAHLFNRLVVWKFKGRYSHCEAIFAYDPKEATQYCASASFMDGGVRFKHIALDAAKWDIIDMPMVDEEKAFQWFADHEGEPYDTRGIVNFLIPVGKAPNAWFCDEALGAAMGLREPERFEPTSLSCVCEFMGGRWLSQVSQQ